MIHSGRDCTIKQRNDVLLRSMCFVEHAQTEPDAMVHFNQALC